MLMNQARAKSIEECILQSHLDVTEVYHEGKILKVGSGAACFSGVDSFLSQVVGWGFDSDEKELAKDIEKIEAFCLSLGMNQVNIELCPLVGNKLINALGQRGYCLEEVNNISVLDLDTYRPSMDMTSFPDIRIITEDDELKSWAKTIAEGFECPEAHGQFYQYTKAASVHAFAIEKEGRIVAGGTIAIHQGICDLGVTSTLPDYRGKGFQKALLSARLLYAKQRHATLASVTTEPGSISDLNIQKSGFGCAYTRLKLIKSL